MIEHLGSIIDKNDEKLFYNYMQFSRAFFKTNKTNDIQLVSANEFYEKVVKSLFILHDNSLRSLNYGLQVEF